MLREVIVNLNKMTVYNDIMDHPLLQKAVYLIKPDKPLEVNDREVLEARLRHDMIAWQYERKLNGKPWKTLIAYLLWESENVFSLAGEKGQRLPAAILELAQRDLKNIWNLFHLHWQTISPELNDFMNQELIFPDFERSFTARKRIKALNAFKIILNSDAVSEVEDLIAQVYRQYGCGLLAQNFAFHGEEELIPIENPGVTPLDALIGYSYQKEVLRRNTRAFIERKQGNHILLFGEKGTGKSTSVKALLHEFSSSSLRMIELNPLRISHMRSIIDRIKGRGFLFILFIDDLSFEDNDTSYKELKSFMEGNLEAAPDNLLIYATSNRRNIVKENWADRAPEQGEVHVSDTYQEKLSLAERFGITLGYYSPDQEQYLDMVEKLAARHHIGMDRETLRALALQWEKKYHGRSGRAAQQFIINLSAEKGG
ncbi:MAG: ATP-binding protein [Syntrophomonadaceae bacterium]|jgi:predicted AAA+ superfamily ATPase|nr:ATP-binding protein [Syntrophomonadaceae bacterium]